MEIDVGGNAEFVLAMLSVSDARVQQVALQKILQTVHYLWPSYFDHVDFIKGVVEQNPQLRSQVAYALAQIYFYANSIKESLVWIVSAESAFNVNERSFFNDSILPIIVHTYVEMLSSGHRKDDFFTRIEAIAEHVLVSSAKLSLDIDKKLIVGLALDAQKSQFIRDFIVNFSSEEIKSAFESILLTLTSHSEGLRKEILNIFKAEFVRRKPKHASELSRVFIALHEAEDHAELLANTWIEGQRELALQMAADIADLGDVTYAEVTLALLREYLQDVQAETLLEVVSGQFTAKLTADFLKHSAVVDKELVKTLTGFWKAKESIMTNAMSFSLATLLCGTNDQAQLKTFASTFENLKHWSQFNASGLLGLVSNGDLAMLQKDLKLPDSPESKGGLHFAGGLANFCRGGSADVRQNLLDRCKSTEQPIAHGALLALGLRFAFSNDEKLVDECRTFLYKEQAVVGEAAGITLGLVKAGSWDNDLADNYINFCRNNPHDRITRSLTLTFGLMALQCGRNETVSKLFDSYISENDATIRACVVNALAMANIGSGSVEISRKLLAVIASDLSDDVRRSAVFGLLFVMINKKSKAISLLSMLSSSYNAYVRHAVALSLGILAANSFDKKVVKVLKKLFEDKTDYVRQAAAIAFGLVFQLGNEAVEPQFETIKKLLLEKIERKFENPISKLGCFMGLSLMQAGGQNCVLSLRSNGGSLKLRNVAAVFLFTHYWYWYPCLMFLPLALEPAIIAGVNANLKLPDSFTAVSKASKRYFDYYRPPENVEEKKKDSGPVVLSITRKARVRQDKKEAEKEPKAPKTDMIIEESKEGEGSPEKAASPEAKDEKKIVTLANPSRVLRRQAAYIELAQPEQSRYVPVIEGLKSGIIFLIDKTPEAPETYAFENKPAAEEPAHSEQENDASSKMQMSNQE